MDQYTKNNIARIRVAPFREGIDKHKVASLVNNIFQVTEQVVSDLAASNREAAHQDLNHISQRIKALQAAIGFPKISEETKQIWAKSAALAEPIVPPCTACQEWAACPQHGGPKFTTREER